MENSVEKRVLPTQHGRRVHFIGIGGVGIYSLARMSMELGNSVSGSDRSDSEELRDLASRGAITYVGTDTAAMSDAETVVYSLAVPEGDEELSYAREVGMRVLTRAEYLGEMMRLYSRSIAVCGSHGKSTVTAMTAHILSCVGKEPTVSIGAPFVGGMPYKSGGSELLVLEACEYRDSFLKLYPSLVCVTNLELDHTDYFPDLAAIKRSFLLFMNRAEHSVVLNADDENLASLMPLLSPRAVSVGCGRTAEYRYSLDGFTDGRITYSIFKNNIQKGRFSLAIDGEFNVANAALAIAACAEYGVSVEDAGRALESFSGIGRRMELIGSLRGTDLIYDYAHHPTEIRAVIDALKMKYARLCVVFKPHTYTRTRDLWFDFAAALSLADAVIITDVYPAREEPIEGISAERLAIAVGDKAVYSPDNGAAQLALGLGADAVVFMGAGDMRSVLAELE